MNARTRLVAGLAMLCLLLGPSIGWADTVVPGHDVLETDPHTTYDDLMLPPGFFDPASDPFRGRVFLKGAPFDCFDPDGPGPAPLFCGLRPADTIVRRNAPAGPVFPDTIPIEILELHLTSVSPITVSIGGGASFQTWNVAADVRVDPATGAIDPPQPPGTMTIRHDGPSGGTFDSSLPVVPYLTFTRVDAPGSIGPIVPPGPIELRSSGEVWCHSANPLGFPPGHVVAEAAGLTSNFFPGVLCPPLHPPWREPPVTFHTKEPPVTYSVDGGAFNPARSGAPNPPPLPPFPTLTPVPNDAEGLFQPFGPHPPPNDVYAVGVSPAPGYASEGDVFQSAGDVLGLPPNVTNVDRMSAALGIGPAPGPPPFLGPFAPNPGAAVSVPPPPGVAGPAGSFGPPPGNTVGTLGLVPDDNLDALSYGRDSGDVLFFSVDPAAMGAPGTAVRFHSTLSPFPGPAAPPFPTNPGGGDPGDEAAGDVYKSVQLLPFGSYIFLHFATGRFVTPAVSSANVLVLDELLLGLQGPGSNGSALGPPEDDLDGLELADTGDLIFGVDAVSNSTGMSPPDGVPDPGRYVFLSVDTASPSNGLLLPSGAVTPDDILVSPCPAFGPFCFSVFADGAIAIGLGVPGPFPPDDLDALAVSDVATLGVMDPGLDEALFSLHPGSPLVQVGPDGIPGTGDELSAADVFYTTFTGTYSLYASAATLGLLFSDNINAIDILPVVDHPAPVPPPPPPPCPCKKLTPEQAMLAAHGIRVAEKKRHFFQSDGTFQVEILPPFPFPGLYIVDVRGATVVETGATSFQPDRALYEIPTEIVQMQLQGFDPVLGPVFVAAGRDLGLPPSPGMTTSVMSGLEFPAESFFDVFVEIQVAGQMLHNEDPFRVSSLIQMIPPYGTTYEGNDPVPLLDPTNMPVGRLTGARHTPRCQGDPECMPWGPCEQGTCDLFTGACTFTPLPDSDADGVCDAGDNCPGTPNPGGQAPVVFGQTIEADPITMQFCWPSPADVVWFSGPLGLVSSYGGAVSAILPGATCAPAPELDNTYYLAKTNCPAGSWQSMLGLERGRDPALP